MTTHSPYSLVTGLVSKGHRIEVLSGELVIESRSDKPIPDDWLPPRRQLILSELTSLMNIPLFSFTSYSTGKWGRTKISGVNLMFQDYQRPDAEPFVIFDAGITHQKESAKHRKGSPLPDGQFWLKSRSHFWRLWTRLKFPEPTRPSLIWRGLKKRLKPLVLTAQYANTTNNPNKLDKNSLVLATITETEIIRAIQQHSIGTHKEQERNMVSTSKRNIENPPAQQPQALEPNPTTGTENHGKRLTGKREPSLVCNEYEGNESNNSDGVDSWIKDYEQPPGCSPFSPDNGTG